MVLKYQRNSPTAAQNLSSKFFGDAENVKCYRAAALLDRGPRPRMHTCAHVLAHTQLITCAHTRAKRTARRESEDVRLLGGEKVREDVDLDVACNAAEGGDLGVEKRYATQRKCRSRCGGG